MADVFISYSRIDQPIIKRLSQTLEDQGFSVWWDRELLGGDNFADDIERELMRAKAVIVGWSQSGSKSRWVRDEASVAADAGTLIAISTDGSIPPIGFRQFHCIDLSKWQGKSDDPAFVDITRAISAKLSPTQKTQDLFDAFAQSAAVPKNRRSTDRTPPLSSNAKIVAVLPFANRSPLPDDAFFADGVHEELLTQISKLAAVQVISRTSVMGYRDSTKSIPEIASELGAMAILEGSVQRAGQRVRINVQLIDGKTDTHIWADIYDRQLTPENIFDIQSDITREIADALQAALSPEDEMLLSGNAPTNNLAAYDAFLRGKQKMRSEASGEEDFHLAIKEFDHAIAVDPQFAEPHANKARAYLTLYWFFGWDTRWLKMAKLSVERAVMLAPNSIETLLAQAYCYYWGELNLEQAERVLNRILDIAPQNTEAWACKSYVIRRTGRFTESISALKKAMRLDPMLVDLPMELGNTLGAIGHIGQAMEMADRVRTLAPKSNFTAIAVADMFHLIGQAQQAYEAASAEVDREDFIYYYRRAFHALNTADPQLIESSFTTWPEKYRGTPMFPETFSLYQAKAYKVLGKQNELAAILPQIQQRLGALDDPYPGGWLPEAAYYPVTLPGLMGNLEEVKAAVEDYHAHAKRDQFATLYHYHSISTAFLFCDDTDSALTYLEKLATIFGPASYLAISIMPQYKVLASQPRYQAMQNVYQQWQAATAR
ncbi:TIR domain-containing protein [Aliiglaciecola sp. CAU 1673]|uniref:TIR domain-containing protein n=1 Tax=Aliiglaciecola sp. CAU 1673 TaxID=3032595 RepID=UPI0023DC2A48|nr:TIR domain-containing protein [Aliiglaciecola sp. CAU 1673]MDF2177179.1 TIR domain-containing protein [Aliiglaciecola sp. CAU 1673]